MSNEEINSQIGEAVKEYSAAKVALAHSEQLLRTVDGNYRRASSVLTDREGDRFTSAQETLEAIGTGSPLVNSERLAELLWEHEQKRVTVATTLARVKKFGLNIE